MRGAAVMRTPNVSSPLWLVLNLIAAVGFGAGYLFAWGRGRRR